MDENIANILTADSTQTADNTSDIILVSPLTTRVTNPFVSVSTAAVGPIPAVSVSATKLPDPAIISIGNELPASPRAERNRRIPERLKDYVLNYVPSNTSGPSFNQESGSGSSHRRHA